MRLVLFLLRVSHLLEYAIHDGEREKRYYNSSQEYKSAIINSAPHIYLPKDLRIIQKRKFRSEHESLEVSRFPFCRPLCTTNDITLKQEHAIKESLPNGSCDMSRPRDYVVTQLSNTEKRCERSCM